MTEKRFGWKTEKLQHSDDEVLLVVDNENKDWKGHILNIVDLLNELSEENEQLKKEKEGWKLSTCRYINKDSILMMDCQIVQEALFELERLIEQDTEQKKKFNDVEEKFKSLVNHYIK